MDIGPAELLIILAILLVLFGGKKIPEIARGLGRAQSEFRRGLEGDGGPATASSDAARRPASQDVAIAPSASTADDDHVGDVTERQISSTT